MLPWSQTRRNDVPAWLNLGVNIIILVLTVEIVKLNRINVYLNSRNVQLNTQNVALNTQREQRQPEEHQERIDLLNEIRKINHNIEKEFKQ